MNKLEDDITALAVSINNGNHKALARAITLVENEMEGSELLLKNIFLVVVFFTTSLTSSPTNLCNTSGLNSGTS